MQTETVSWGERSPLASVIHLPEEAPTGPVKYLLVSQTADDGRSGFVGALWVSIDGQRGGFVASPKAMWAASEMARNHGAALERGWTPETIFRYWADTHGDQDRLRFDPPGTALSLEVLRQLLTIG